MKLPPERDDVVNVERADERDPRVYRASTAFRSYPIVIDEQAALEQRMKFYSGEKSAQ